MRLSTKGQYAVTAMLDLALNSEEKHRVTLADISYSQGISLSYLEQLFAHLRRSELVQGTRGPGGGYRLARPAEHISIAEIIAAIDDKAKAAKATRKRASRAAASTERQPTQELWNSLSRTIYDFLDNISLGDLVEHSQSGAPLSNSSDAPWSDKATNHSPATA